MKKLKNILAVILFAGCAVIAALALSGCKGYCQHKLEEVPKVVATCQEKGLRTAYRCTKCGKLFGYDVAKGEVYEIAEQEVTDYGKHVPGETFKPHVPEGAESFSDLGVESECAVCGENFAVDEENLFAFAPKDVNTYEHKKEGTVHYTEYTFPAGSAADTMIKITHDDSGADPFISGEVSFEDNVAKNCVIYFKNDSDVDVDVVFGTENWYELCQTEVTTVPAHGYAAAELQILYEKGASRCYFELYLKTAITEEVKIGVCGCFFQEASKLQTVEFVGALKTEFFEGETISAENIAFKHTYLNGTSRIVSGEGATSEMFGKALTMDDKEVELEYRGKKYKFNINVKSTKRTLTIVGATFADGTNTMTLDKDAGIPNNIKYKKNAMFLYWTDTFRNTYKNSEFNMNGRDWTLKAVYAGLDGEIIEDEKGENYARSKTCFASETGFNPTTFGLGNLTDGNRGGPGSYNAWGSNNHSSLTEEVWVKVDLGEIMEINNVDLYERGDGSFFPKAYYIEVSEDDENYTRVFTMDDDIYTSNGNSYWGYARECYFATVNARYVKITSTLMTTGGNSSERYVQYAEIEVYNVK